MRCGEEIEIFTSSVMWEVWAEEQYFTHHTRRKFNFDRLLYIIFFTTQIHRVRFFAVNGEASTFLRIFFLGSGSGFHYEIHSKKLFFIYLRYPLKLVSLRKFFVKIKILFRIRIRIMILLWISMPDLHFIHRRDPPNFVWIR